MAGRQINLNSARQLAPLLFEELELPSGRRTKTGFSVDSEVLENLRHRHPIVDLILEYRTLAKLKSTYVDALPLQVNSPHRDESTRRSTRRSPRPVASRRPIRTCRTSRSAPSWAGACGARSSPTAARSSGSSMTPVLVSADYSQIELRLLAHMSGEPFLIDAFARGEDIHR